MGKAGQQQAILSARLTAGDSPFVGQPSTLISADLSWEHGVVERPTPAGHRRDLASVLQRR